MVRSAELQPLESHKMLTTSFQTSCSFTLPIDNDSWQFFRQGSKIIVRNVVVPTISKILLDMDTKMEADDLLGRLQHYSHQAGQESQKQKTVKHCMSVTPHQPLDDSSMDESTTASVDETSTVEPSNASLFDFYPKNISSTHMPTFSSELHQPHSQHPTAADTSLGWHTSPLVDNLHLGPPPAKRHIHIQSSSEPLDSIHSKHIEDQTPFRSTAPVADNSYDIFEQLDHQSFIEPQEARIVRGLAMLEPETNAVGDASAGVGSSTQHPSLGHYHAVVDDVWDHWNHLAADEREEWSYED